MWPYSPIISCGLYIWTLSYLLNLSLASFCFETLCLFAVLILLSSLPSLLWKFCLFSVVLILWDTFKVEMRAKEYLTMRRNEQKRAARFGQLIEISCWKRIADLFYGTVSLEVSSKSDGISAEYYWSPSRAFAQHVKF